MYITVEELYDLKNKYIKEIIELEMKKAVVDDLISIAEAKKPVVEGVCEDEEETEEVVEETTTDESY
jgi:hypothetical protein